MVDPSDATFLICKAYPEGWYKPGYRGSIRLQEFGDLGSSALLGYKV